MTCLIAVEKDGKIYYAGDRCESVGYGRMTLAHSKWLVHRNWRIGISGSAKLAALLKSDGRWRNILGPAGEEDQSQVFAFARSAQEIVNGDHGWDPEKNEGSPGAHNTSLIVASPVGVFIIGSAFGVSEPISGHMVALGVGGDFAIGAWEVCQRLAKKTSVADQMTICMETAAKYANGVSAPFDFGSIDLMPGHRRRPLE